MGPNPRYDTFPHRPRQAKAISTLRILADRYAVVLQLCLWIDELKLPAS